MKIPYDVTFHAVGQGLFCSGRIGDSDEIFRFVYDCGTSSSQKLIDSSLALVAPKSTPIDLVVVSHFDSDHISGLVRLLRTFPVRVLMLPAVHFELRLLYAFAARLPVGARNIGFYVDPVGFVTSLPEAHVDHVVLVPPSGGEAPAPEEAPELPEGPLPGLSGRLSDTGPESFDVSSPGGTQVHVLAEGGRLVARRFFEFVPYNDAAVGPKLPTRFVGRVRKEKAVLLSRGQTNSGRKASLSRLRDIYDKKFGKGSCARNVISLFVYAGLVPTAETCCAVAVNRREGGAVADLLSQRSVPRSNILFTGDGYLDTPGRIRRIANYLGRNRTDRVGCLQVMHHGARGCWHPSAPDVLSPMTSVFSCDPGHKRFQHPHGEVARSFVPYGPMRADKENAVTYFVNRCDDYCHRVPGYVSPASLGSSRTPGGSGP